MRTLTLEGLDKNISQLVLGCDNKIDVDQGAPLWSAFVDSGGTAFDTAHIYADGACERALGDWLASEKLHAQTVVVVKGAHSPYCDPENLTRQLHESLERLHLEAADIYIMHRDNIDIPVDEFVDVLNVHHTAGLIRIFGASNWTVERFRAANAYALARGLRGFSALNNNLSLAQMVKPVWPGCVSSSSDETIAFLTDAQVAHFSWSSQARGYFFAEPSREALNEGTGPEDCFDSKGNRERRRRAARLGAHYGVSAAHIATAFVLSQPFPSFALIGPRTVVELSDCMCGPDLRLSHDELQWLNLKSDSDPHSVTDLG